MKENEYIITDSMLMIWRTGCIRAASKDPDKCNGCEYDNKDRGGCDFDDDAMQKIFQSRSLTDIIKELKQNEKDAYKQTNTVFHDDNCFSEGRAKAYTRAIKLLKEGVKKP